MASFNLNCAFHRSENLSEALFMHLLFHFLHNQMLHTDCFKHTVSMHYIAFQQGRDCNYLKVFLIILKFNLISNQIRWNLAHEPEHLSMMSL